MPASNKPYRRFDEQGNRQYAPNRQGVYDKYPQYRLAMLGIIAALGAYAITGQIVPGLW